MKKIHLFLFIAIVSFAMLSCQKNALQENKPTTSSATQALPTGNNTLAGRNQTNAGPCNPNAFAVTLESRTQVGTNWVWVWSVQNSNPGNGNNGTVQDLSHWGMQVGTCLNWSSVVSAAYSADGVAWTSFAPSYQADPSQQCMTTAVLKFDYGTTGSAKSYYKLVISQNLPTGPSSAYYKSGANTGCCTFSFTGIGCDDDGGGGIR